MVLVDDHRIFLDGLATILGTQSDFEVVQVALDRETAMSCCRDNDIDLVLLDLDLGAESGLKTLDELQMLDTPPAVIILTGCTAAEPLLAAVQAGARGYLVKTLAPAELFTQIRRVHQGHAALDADAAALIMGGMHRPAPASSGSSRDLSPRELEVLGFIVDGYSNKEIANTLCIAQNTVKNHVKRLLGKLGVENRTQAATLALRQHLIPDRDIDGSR